MRCSSWPRKAKRKGYNFYEDIIAKFDKDLFRHGTQVHAAAGRELHPVNSTRAAARIIWATARTPELVRTEHDFWDFKLVF